MDRGLNDILRVKRHQQNEKQSRVECGVKCGGSTIVYRDTVIHVHSDSRPQMSKRPNLILCQLPDPAENGSDRINLNENKKLSIPA